MKNTFNSQNKMLRWAMAALACAWALAACSSTETNNGPVYYDVAGEDGAGGEISGADAGKTDGSADSGQDGGLSDATTDQDSVADTAPVEDIDWSELLDPEDTASTGDTSVEPTGPVGQLYAHTATELYRLDLADKKFTLVGTFTFDKNGDDVTDMALDQGGAMYICGHKDLFQCDVNTAKCKWLVALGQEFNGMTFVPKGTVSATEETLIGIAQSGDWTKITISGGKVTLKVLGSYGGSWLSSGDAFSVEGIGTYATLKKSTTTTDTLASIDPKTGKILKIIGDTGVAKLFGFAWWSGVFYGFATDGNVYTLDVNTGKASLVKGIATPKGAKWWGAGVSTRAAGKIIP
ncbi:MAG: hypothetical protein HY902_02195 [Deltaproteobacteria bacterium]|nr:hypothetical protein [Deltaproteobacteria bacterium]